jgi:hypothetical protein
VVAEHGAAGGGGGVAASTVTLSPQIGGLSTVQAALTALAALVPVATSSHLYVGGVGADDSADGTSTGTSLATLDEAFRRGPTQVTLLSPGPYSIDQALIGTPRASALVIDIDAGALTDLFGELEASAFEHEPENRTLTVNVGVELAEGELQGKCILYMSQYLVIIGNTASDEGETTLSLANGFVTLPESVKIVDLPEIHVPTSIVGGAGHHARLAFRAVKLSPQSEGAPLRFYGAIEFGCVLSHEESTITVENCEVSDWGWGIFLTCLRSNVSFRNCRGYVDGSFRTAEFVGCAAGYGAGDKFGITFGTFETLSLRSSDIFSLGNIQQIETLTLDAHSTFTFAEETPVVGPYSGAWAPP